MRKKDEYKVKRNALLIWFLRYFFKWYLKRHFNRISIANLPAVKDAINRSKKENIPLVFILNHPNWWDAGIAAYLALSFLKIDSYCIIEDVTINEHKFFRYAGGISLERGKPKKAMQALDYAAEKINNKPEALWIFPQGELSPNERPVKFYNGISYLLEKTGEAILVSAHLEYKYTAEQYPEAYINFFNIEDKPAVFNRKHFTLNLQKKFDAEIRSFNKKFEENNLGEYEAVMKGRTSIDRWFPV